MIIDNNIEYQEYVDPLKSIENPYKNQEIEEKKYIPSGGFFYILFNDSGKMVDFVLDDEFLNSKKKQELENNGYLKISEGDWNYYIGNIDSGVNGNGYIIDFNTKKPISAPILSKIDKMNLIKEKYEKEVEAYKQALLTAELNDDQELILEIKQEYTEFMNNYLQELNGVENNG